MSLSPRRSRDGTLVNILEQPGFFYTLQGLFIRSYRKFEEVLRQEEFVSLPGRCLDLGCGVGRLASLFPPAIYVGVDIDEDYIRFAKQRFARPFLVADARHLCFAEGSFSKVYIAAVIHHLSDADIVDVNKEIQRVISPGGRVLVIDAIPPRSRINLLGELLRRLDRGEYIRSMEGYRKILGRDFLIEKEYRLSSWPIDYGVFVLRKVARCDCGDHR